MAENETNTTTNSQVLDNIIQLMLSRDPNSGLRDSIERHHTKIADAAKSSKVVINDDYGNSLLSIGNEDKSAEFTKYTFDNDTLNWWLWTTLYNDSWVFKRAIDKPAQDEVRCGVTIQCKHNNLPNVYRRLKQYRTDFINLLQWGALYGGSIACMMFDNIEDADYLKPMTKSTIMKSKSMKLYVVDRWYGVQPSDETVDDMTSIDFGKPKYYTVAFPDGNQVKFHHDYVLRYEHRTAPKLIKCGMLQGWGYAEGSHILQQLMRDDKLESSIQSLVDKSLIEVIKMSGMRGVFMGGDTQSNDQLRKRLEMVNWARNFNSLTFLDEDDEYQEHSFAGLGGLSDLLEKNMWRISAALEMQGVLYGDLKQGFSNDSDSLERYDETINNRCESYLRPVYEKFIRVLYMLEGIEEKVDFTFNSLLMKKQDKERMEDVNRFVDLLSKLLADGVIELEQYAQSLETYTSKGMIDFNFTQASIEKLKEKQVEENEMFGEDFV